MRSRALSLACVTSLLATAGCVSIGTIDLRTHECATTFTRQLADILISQDEPPLIAQELARDATLALLTGEASPADFYVSSTTGTDYAFFIQRKRSSCVLRLYRRLRLRSELTNTLTYIASRPLTGCGCDP